jgi:hypothetical protein
MKVLIRSTCRDEEELTKRNGWKLDGRSALALETSSAGSHARGYTWLYDTFITQANEDCDFAFLRKGDINKLSPNLRGDHERLGIAIGEASNWHVAFRSFTTVSLLSAGRRNPAAGR